MYLLKKVFQLRDKANPDMEKPFLEHLEDLRVMITRVVITLVVSMIACFSLQKPLMHILRKPAEDVWTEHARKSLPPQIDIHSWEKAKLVEEAAASLEGEVRDAFLANYDPATRNLVESAKILRAANLLPEDQRAAFIRAAVGDQATLGETLDLLIETGANPAIGQGSNLMLMSALRPTEPFMLSMKLAFFAGLVVSFPFLLYFILQFVLPGLHTHEKRVIWPAMAVGFGLFLSGVFFAYFLVLPRALVFFYEWGLDMGVENDWRIGDYISFATQFTLLFGLSFELPVVVMVFVKLGLLTFEMMHRTRAYAVLAIVVIAAAITPTSDLISLSAMAIPMYLLYEACIWLAWLDERKRRRREEEESRDRLDHLLTDDGDAEKEATAEPADHGEKSEPPEESDDADEQEDRGDPLPPEDSEKPPGEKN